MRGDEEVDAIVGAALKAMAESGVGHARLGAFAASFRSDVQQILGLQPPPAATEPDLLPLIKRAVLEALSDPAVAAGVPRAHEQPRETAHRIYVKVNGRSTSVTLSAQDLHRLDSATGSRRQSRAIIQELASGAPGNVNRSGWIRDRMMALASSRHSAPTEARH